MLFVKGRLQLANLKLQNLRDELPLRVKKIQKLEATLSGARRKDPGGKDPHCQAGPVQKLFKSVTIAGPMGRNFIKRLFSVRSSEMISACSGVSIRPDDLLTSQSPVRNRTPRTT